MRSLASHRRPVNLPAKTPLEKFLEAIGDANNSGGEYSAFCPVCQPDGDPKGPKLYFSQGRKALVLDCKHDCPVEDIAAALGLEMSDLFVAEKHNRVHKHLSRPDRKIAWNNAKQVNAPREEPTADNTKRWTSKALRCEQALTPKQRKTLANELDVSVGALKSLHAGWHSELGKYTFPEQDGGGNFIGIGTRGKNGKKGQVKGGNRGLLIPDGLDKHKGVILAPEGPTDTAACVAMGLPAIGRPTNTVGAKHLADRIGDRDCIIVADFDPRVTTKWPGLTGAQSVTQKVANHLNRPIRYALVPDGAKDVRAWLQAQNVDLNDTVACHAVGEKLLASLEKEAIEVKPTPSRFTIHTGEELIKRPLPKYQIAGIVTENSSVIVFGPSGWAKTWLVIDWALCTENGCPWLGHACVQGHVVYVAAEGGSALGGRLRAWELGHPGYSAKSLGVLTTAPNLLIPKDVDALIAAIHNESELPSIVFVDTMSRTLVGGDENSACDVGLFVAATDRIRTEFGCTVVVVHHTGKDQKAERGSSALRGAADVMVKTVKHADSPQSFQLKCEKVKDGPEFPPIDFKLQIVELNHGATSCFITPKRLGPTCAQDLLAILKDKARNRASKWFSYSEWRDLSGLPKTTFKTYLKTLKKKRLVRDKRNGRKVLYRVSENE